MILSRHSKEYLSQPLLDVATKLNKCKIFKLFNFVLNIQLGYYTSQHHDTAQIYK